LIKSSDIEFWSVSGDGFLYQKLSSNVLNNMFASLTGVQNRDLRTDVKVIAIVNRHASLALTSMRVYFRVINSGGATLSIALDTLAPQVSTGKVAEPGTGPASFSTPTTVGTGLSVATLNPGFAQGIWVKRIATASAAVRPERNTLTVSGTSAA
jgi:hypothetical protein